MFSCVNCPPSPINIELGFVDTVSNAAGENTFSLDANGTPLDANLDVWSKAGGAFKPWVYKTTFAHAGGALAIHFVGLTRPAFVSYARFTDASGKELAFGGGTGWLKSERLTLLDSRSRPFHTVKVGEVPFFDVDHSPVGAWSTFIYGMEQSGGVQVCKQPGGDGTLVPDQGSHPGGEERRRPSGSCRLPPIRSCSRRARLVTDREIIRDAWSLHGQLADAARRELDALHPRVGHEGLGHRQPGGTPPVRAPGHVDAVSRR